MLTISQDYLKSVLHYNHESGVFTWLHREVDGGNFNINFSGKTAGTKCSPSRGKTSYVTIGLLGKNYRAHRLAFMYVKGFMPKEVDHIDHNGMNNKWSNLRASNSKDNTRNMPKRKDNTSGVVGVCFEKRYNKWRARANNQDGKRISLGYFSSLDEAITARKDHEVKFGYYESRGDL